MMLRMRIDAADFAAGGNMPTVFFRLGWATAKLLVNQPGGGGVLEYEVSCDWRFQTPPYTLRKQEGLQLAEASFRDKLEIQQ